MEIYVKKFFDFNHDLSYTLMLSQLQTQQLMTSQVTH